MSKTIKLTVYSQDNDFEFCINGKYVEFENIINILKNISILNNKKDCILKNPIYTFEIKIKNNGSGTSGFTLELSLTMVNGNDIDTITSEPIKIQVVSKNEENYFIIKDKEINCSDIIAQLLKLIDVPKTAQDETFDEFTKRVKAEVKEEEYDEFAKQVKRTQNQNQKLE